MQNSKIILITGPAGSGKSSLAERIAENEGWIHVSEDLYWVEIKKGHPAGEGRTLEEQDIIQPAVARQVRELLSGGKNVVLEFINYEDPPRPLIYYYEELRNDSGQILVVALKPNEQVIMERKLKRGRASDQDLEKEFRNARHQLACLESGYIRKEWGIDSSSLTVEEIYAGHLRAFVEQGGFIPPNAPPAPSGYSRQ